MRVVHAVVTDAFAGTERYVVDVANRQVELLDVTVIAGPAVRDRLDGSVRWLPGATVAQALRSAARLRQVDVAHAHLTYGEFVLAMTQRLHGGRLLATRHLATPRGQSRVGAVMRPVIERRLWRQLAISRFVGDAVGVPEVLPNGVAPRDRLQPELRTTVLMAQRLEAEKSTQTGVRAWFASSLPQAGWTLAIAGDGAERGAVEALVSSSALRDSVHILGHVQDMDAVYADAAALLAPAPAEPLGLSVLEAMSWGVPVVAAAGGGHLETLAGFPELLFPVGDVEAAAAALDRLCDTETRRTLSAAVREAQRRDFDLDDHVRRLVEQYR